MTIFITGSSGKTAAPLTALLKQTHPILVASRKLKADSAYPTVAFDWLDESSWDNPFQHEQAQISPVTATYLVSPDIQEARDQVIPFVKFALEKGVKRFVLLSAWEVPEGGPLLGRTHAGLKAIGQNGVEWTVLRPHFFMENFTEPYHLPCIKEENRIYTACEDGKKPYISTRDIAAVAYRALTDDKSHNTEYVITGTQSLTYDEIATVFSDVLGRKIEHVRLTKEELNKKLLSFEYPEGIAGYLAQVDEDVAKGLGWQPTQNVKLVTGKEPWVFKDWVEDNKTIWT